MESNSNLYPKYPIKQKFVVIDGVDGSGKTTQVDLMADRLDWNKLKFPNYNIHSGKFIREYLNGKMEWLKEEYDIATYTQMISSLYSLNRLETFNINNLDGKNIKDRMESRSYVSDRYTSSNILIQSANFSTKEEVDEYIEWLEDCEFNILALPKPDVVIFLDIPKEVALENISKRNTSKDITETEDYIERVYKWKDYILEKMNWEVIECYDEDMKKMHTPNYINNKIKEVIDRDIPSGTCTRYKHNKEIDRWVPISDDGTPIKDGMCIK